MIKNYHLQIKRTSAERYSNYFSCFSVIRYAGVFANGAKAAVSDLTLILLI